MFEHSHGGCGWRPVWVTVGAVGGVLCSAPAPPGQDVLRPAGRIVHYWLPVTRTPGFGMPGCFPWLFCLTGAAVLPFHVIRPGGFDALPVARKDSPGFFLMALPIAGRRQIAVPISYRSFSASQFTASNLRGSPRQTRRRLLPRRTLRLSSNLPRRPRLPLRTAPRF